MASTSAATQSAPRRYSAGSKRLLDQLQRGRQDALKPPPSLTVSQWANKYAVLSAETSADAGQFTSFAYQNGIMDAVSDPKVKTISVLKSARVGYTRILDNIIGYFIHQDPSPMLVVQPTDNDAEDYSETEIAPMLRDTPVLAEIVGDMNARNSGQKIEKRSFKNGASVKFIGANSPNGFRRISVRVVAFDEVDGYPAQGAGDDGDQIALGTKRTETFWNYKVIMGSTPTLKGISRIEKAYEESDQRRYYVPCPHCGTKQVLKWENLKWEKDAAGNHLTKTAHFRCEANGCRIEEHDKKRMINAGEWVAEKPFISHAGFHIWTAYSLFPNASWSRIATEWLEVYKDPMRRKTFVNTTLGLPYQEAVEVTDPDLLKQRAEPYNWETLPADARLLTFGADTQDDRIEVTFVAWGANGESWIARHEVIYGDTSKLYVWEEFDKILLEPCITDEGRVLVARAGCVDTGGHRSQIAMKFCQDRKRRKIYGIVGRGNIDPRHPKMVWPKTASRSKNSSDKPIVVGVDTAKDDISSRLAIVPHESEPTARAIHFPMLGLSGDYFEQLTSEHAVVKYVNNKPRRSWEPKKPGARNEAWDCLVYAFAARLSLPVKLDKAPGRARREREAQVPKDEAVPVVAEAAPVEPVRRVRKAPTAANDNPPRKRERAQWAAYK